MKAKWDYDAGKKQDNVVYDYWEVVKNKVRNTVLCDNTILHVEKLNIPSIPILIMPVPTRPPVANSSGVNAVEGYGESIFASIRGINGINNRVLSTIATHAYLEANQALLNYKDDLGVTVDSTTNVPGGVIELARGHQELKESPMREISPTITGLADWLSARVADGTLPDISVGTPPQSGTLQSIVQEAGNKIFNPQLRLLNNFYTDACHLIEEQLLVDKLKVKVRQEYKRKYYEEEVTPIDLKKAHKIMVEFTARTPSEDAVVAQQADMLKRLGLPNEWIWENILKVQDPKQLADLVAIEIFEHSPIGLRKRAIEALMRIRGDVEASQSLAEEMDRVEAQETMPPPGMEMPSGAAAMGGGM